MGNYGRFLIIMGNAGFIPSTGPPFLEKGLGFRVEGFGN